MTIIEFFDVHNQNHLRAYQHLQNTGLWDSSSDFYEEIKELEFPTNWQISVASLLASAYIDEHMNE